MNNYSLSQVVNSLFRLKKSWPEIDSESKAAAAFIINRQTSKKYPSQAEKLNSKGLDLTIVTEIWNIFHKSSIRVPDWFWTKPTINKAAKFTSEEQYILDNYYQVAEDIEFEKLKKKDLKTEKITKSKKK